MQTVQMTRDEIAARTGRFAQLQPMEFMKNDTTVSQAAKDIILARKLMPVVLERTQSAFGNDAPIYNAAGLTMFISIMPPGQDRKSTRLNSSHLKLSRMPSSA